MVRELTPEPAPKSEPRDRSGHDDILRQIAELNDKKSPWMEQNQGIYKAQAGLQSLLGEEDRASEQDYQRRLQEQTMYGKNMTNQQRVDAQRYGYDQRLAGLLGVQGMRGDVSTANNQNTNQTRLGVQDLRNQGNLDVTGLRNQGNATVAGINVGGRVTPPGMNNDPPLAVQGMPRRSASAGADNSAIPKLPADTQKRINSIVTDTTLSDQDKGVQLNQVLSPLGLAWSYRDKTIVRKPTMGSGGGIKGTNPATPAAASP